MEAISPNHSQKVIEDFASVVSERILPVDMVTKVVILAQGALWRHRMTRNPSSGGNNARRAALAVSAAATEHRIGTHLLCLHRTLLEIGVAQLEETPEDAGDQDLAQRITAIFRRMLPALRMASKSFDVCWTLIGHAIAERAGAQARLVAARARWERAATAGRLAAARALAASAAAHPAVPRPAQRGSVGTSRRCAP